jgi:hypothetical protein
MWLDKTLMYLFFRVWYQQGVYILDSFLACMCGVLGGDMLGFLTEGLAYS